MKSAALRVPRGEAESVRARLRQANLLRPDLRVVREGSDVLFPVRPGVEGLGLSGKSVEHEFEPLAAPPPASYRDRLRELGVKVEDLPRAFDVIGDIVLVRLPDSAMDRAEAVGRALLDSVPGARLVGLDRGVHGPERRRSVQRLAGEGTWATRHRENGLEISVDVEAAYFSPRLAREHQRVADAVPYGATVYDLCCGVGPFALTIAARGVADRVVAVDSNAAATGLLRASIERSGFAGRIDVMTCQIEEFLPSARPVERVVFNLPREGIKYAPSVGTVVAPAGRLFYYEVVDRGSLESHAARVLAALGEPGRWRCIGQRIVHPYSPCADLVGFTFERAVS